MGRKLDLSKLTDEEVNHVWEVVQRDLDLRKKEEERLEELKGKIHKESMKKELLSDQAHLNQTHCGHCLQPYRFLVNSRQQCLDCHLFTCKKCSSYNRREQGWVCDSCRLARVVKTGSLNWYYEHVRARFKHSGSAKVLNSLHGRLQHEQDSSPALGLHHRSCSLPDVNSATQLSPIEGSGDSEQTSEEEVLCGAEAQHLSREKRLLSVHPFDFEVDSDCSAQSYPQSLQFSPAPTTLDSLQVLGIHSDSPSADDKEAAWEDALVTEASLAREAQDLPKEQERNSPKVSLPSDSSLERKPSPDGEAVGSDQSHVQYFADMDTSDEDIEEAHKMTAHPPHHSKRRSWASSQESMAPSETQISDMNRHLLAIECLLARLEERILVPWEESFRPQPHTDVDIEEEALKRKLGELTSKVSDKGGSSEEEEEDQSVLSPGRSSIPGTQSSEDQQADQIHGGEHRLLNLEEQVPRTRSPESALSELEDQAALTATEVQQAKREVSDIKSRIAALSAAGLLVNTWEKPRKESNLQVMARSRVQRRIRNNSLKLQDRVDDPFRRKSVYRGSLTQRNPNVNNRRADHIFAKPVMTHQP
ncbi:melanophilin isoform X2 [Notamacropus eugenii]|uniref:melanophilin isoform X2 n=1 Tax=Notamacropus eugenii TaxID=9315 RepID=UPI003B685AFD